MPSPIATPLTSFGAGLVSFLSPCVLPLVPGYVSLVSGVGVEELKAPDVRLLRRVMLQSVMFILGFSAVFVSLGLAASSIGQLLATYRTYLAHAAGVVIILFGLHLTGIFRINALYADKRLHGVKGGSSPWGAFVIGFSFAFGWTPCVGPVLSSVLTLAAAEDTVWKGGGLLAIYSLGLAVPFLLTSVGIERFLVFYQRFQRHMHVLEVASGVLLMVLGVLLVLGRFTLISGYFSFLNRFAL
jgi:cytochrome c-type biogenesis protein